MKSDSTPETFTRSPFRSGDFTTAGIYVTEDAGFLHFLNIYGGKTSMGRLCKEIGKPGYCVDRIEKITREQWEEKRKNKDSAMQSHFDNLPHHTMD